MAETPRARPPVRPPPPVPVPVPVPEPRTPPPESSPSTPGEDYHTPTPSLDEAREETPPWQQEEANGRASATKSPPLSPVRFPSQQQQQRLPPPDSPTGNGEEGPAPAPGRRPQLRLATGLVRTPSQGSLANKSPSPSVTPPSPLTPAPAANGNGKSAQSTPKRAEAWKQPPPATPISVPFDPDEEAITSPLQLGKARLDSQRSHAPGAAAEHRGDGRGVPADVAAVAAVGERRPLSAGLRVATAVLSLASFAVMLSARTSGWDGDFYGRYVQYRYAIGVNVIVCVYSIAQAGGEIRRLVWPRFIYRSMSSYYVSLFLDQVLAYLLMSASSAAASRNDLWVSRFGQDAFNKKISSAVWLSFLGFLTLAASSLISTANLFSMV